MRYRELSIAALPLLLVACGGGGGGSDDGAGDDSGGGGDTGSISTEQAVTAAGDSYGAATKAFSAGNAGLAAGMQAMAGAYQGTAVGGQGGLGRQLAASGRMLAAATSSASGNCVDGGTFSVTQGQSQNTFDFNQCASPGGVVDGSMTMNADPSQVTSAGGTIGFTYENFTVSNADGVTGLDGTFEMRFGSHAGTMPHPPGEIQGHQAMIEVRMPAMTVTEQTADGSSTHTVENAGMFMTDADSSYANDVQAPVWFTLHGIGASATDDTYKTCTDGQCWYVVHGETTTFKWTALETGSYPVSGSLKIRGDNGSVSLNADTGNPDTVQIAVSDTAGGTLTIDEVNWSELDGAGFSPQ